MTDGMPSGYMVDLFESAGVEPVVSVEDSEKNAQEDEEHTDGNEHTEEDEHMIDEHAHSGFMVRVPVTHDIYALSFTVPEDMVGEWEIECFLLDGVHHISGMVGTLTVEE